MYLHMTKAESSLLLYLEECCVNKSGRVDGQKINAADRDIIKKWVADGYIQFGRIIHANCTEEGSEWVRLSSHAWNRVGIERAARADRMWTSKRFQTTAEKKEG